MEPVEAVEWASCHCSKCHFKLFELQNSWYRVTPTYLTLSSAVGGLHIDDIATVSLEEGEQDSGGELTGCTVRKFNCTNCDRYLGIKVLQGQSKPQQLLLGHGILRSSRFNLFSLDSAAPVGIKLEEQAFSGSAQTGTPQQPIGNWQYLDQNMNDHKSLTRANMQKAMQESSKPALGESDRARSINGSVAPSVLSIPRRAAISNEDKTFNTVIAKLNVITSQLSANEARFEAQRIQIDEQQTQLDALQSQSDQIIDLLETLTQSITTLTDNLHSLPRTTVQTELDNDIRPREWSNAHETPRPQTPTKQSTLKKLKRGVGRPRTRCAACKKNPPIEGLKLCGNCEATSRVKKRYERPTSIGVSATKRRRTSGSIASSSSPKEQEEPEDRGITPIHESIEVAPHVPRPSTSVPVRDASTGELKKTTDGLSAPTSSVNLVLDRVRDSQSRSNSVGGTTPAIRPSSVKAPITSTMKSSLNKGPFEEDSIPPGTMLLDIPDTQALRAISLSRTRSGSRATSIAESLSLEELLDQDTVMRDTQSSLEEGEIRSQGYSTGQTKQKDKVNAQQQAASLRTAKPIGSVRNPRAATANMGPTSVNGDVAKRGPGRPRKPRPSDAADGDDGHHILMKKVVGPGWKGVQRKF